MTSDRQSPITTSPAQMPSEGAVTLLKRLVRIADSGQFRDKAGLSLSAHPAVDDAREFVAVPRPSPAQMPSEDTVARTICCPLGCRRESPRASELEREYMLALPCDADGHLEQARAVLALLPRRSPEKRFMRFEKDRHGSDVLIERTEDLNQTEVGAIMEILLRSENRISGAPPRSEQNARAVAELIIQARRPSEEREKIGEEPTEEMTLAGAAVLRAAALSSAEYRANNVYRAMRAPAPSPACGEVQETIARMLRANLDGEKCAACISKPAIDVLAERIAAALTPPAGRGEGWRKLNTRQRIALLTDERAIEELDFRDRDGLIVAGFARRAWPEGTGDQHWRTWLTPEGVQAREALTKALPPDSEQK